MSDVTEADVRARVEQLLAEHGDDDETAFLGAQFDAGLARMDYPVGLGGLDASTRSCRRSSTRRSKRAGRRYPWIRNAMGIGMCGPTIVARGTREQQERFLRPIFTAEEIWCQLFSEPGAGSDVAGLADPRGARRRRVDRERLEDLDVDGAQGALRPAAGAHRSRRAEAQGPHRVHHRHAPARASRCARIRSMAGASGFNEVFFTDADRPRLDARRRRGRRVARRPTPRS